LSLEPLALNPEFPLKDVIIKKSPPLPDVENPLFADETRKVAGDEFLLNVPGVGGFYASKGVNVEFTAVPGADPEWVRLILNSQLLVALLHQRKIINFHASSFIYNGIGILILGETGAGKSSLTTAFTLGGAGFLADDMTPVIFKDQVPYIWPLYREIKIDANTISQLAIGPDRLRPAEKGTGKYYFEAGAETKAEEFSLDVIIKIETGKVSKPEFLIPDPAEKFSLLRSEICSWEILSGMAETEKDYLHQLLQIIQKVKMVKVIRPDQIGIREMQLALEEYLDENVSK